MKKKYFELNFCLCAKIVTIGTIVSCEKKKIRRKDRESLPWEPPPCRDPLEAQTETIHAEQQQLYRGDGKRLALKHREDSSQENQELSLLTKKKKDAASHDEECDQTKMG